MLQVVQSQKRDSVTGDAVSVLSGCIRVLVLLTAVFVLLRQVEVGGFHLKQPFKEESAQWRLRVSTEYIMQ